MSDPNFEAGDAQPERYAILKSDDESYSINETQGFKLIRIANIKFLINNLIKEVGINSRVLEAMREHTAPHKQRSLSRLINSQENAEAIKERLNTACQFLLVMLKEGLNYPSDENPARGVIPKFFVQGGASRSYLGVAYADKQLGLVKIIEMDFPYDENQEKNNRWLFGLLEKNVLPNASHYESYRVAQRPSPPDGDAPNPEPPV